MTERISFTYPGKLKDVLIKLAKKEDRSTASYITKVLKNHVKRLGIDIETGKRAKKRSSSKIKVKRKTKK
jgi:hypothetical protein